MSEPVHTDVVQVVGSRELIERPLGNEREHAVVGGDRAGLPREERDARAREPAEDLIGTDRVEGREPVV
jgi:hypothetical protein